MLTPLDSFNTDYFQLEFHESYKSEATHYVMIQTSFPKEPGSWAVFLIQKDHMVSWKHIKLILQEPHINFHNFMNTIASRESERGYFKTFK